VVRVHYSKRRDVYTGMASDVQRRFKEHQAASYLVELLYTEEFPSKFAAAKRERQIKGWTRKKKRALIDGDFKLLRDL
jgi:predicted GIY-YIG superfamily endonuclease